MQKNISQELQILLALSKLLKKVFPKVLIAGLQNGKCLKDYLARAELAQMGSTESCEKCHKGTCQVCHYINRKHTFTVKPPG